MISADVWWCLQFFLHVSFPVHSFNSFTGRLRCKWHQATISGSSHHFRWRMRSTAELSEKGIALLPSCCQIRKGRLNRSKQFKIFWGNVSETELVSPSCTRLTVQKDVFLQMGNLISLIFFTVGFSFWRRRHFEFQLVYCSGALSFCQYDYISSLDSLVIYDVFIVYSLSSWHVRFTICHHFDVFPSLSSPEAMHKSSHELPVVC